MSEHRIDIKSLTNSLIGLSNLIQEANKLANGEETKINIQVKAGVEQNCFELEITFISTLLERVAELFQKDHANIEEVLKWLGLLKGAGISYGLFELIKLFKGRKIEQEKIVSSNDDGVTINTGNNSNITVNKNVYNFYNDNQINKTAQQFIEPLRHDGFNNIDIIGQNNEQGATSLIKNDYSEFLNYNIDDRTEELTETNITTRNLIVNRPELNSKSTTWDFMLGYKKISVDISSTNIAEQTMNRGEVRVGDTYKVELEEKEYTTPKGQFRIKYKILNVLDFKRGVEQLRVDEQK